VSTSVIPLYDNVETVIGHASVSSCRNFRSSHSNFRASDSMSAPREKEAMKAKKNRGILSEPAAVDEEEFELVDSDPPTRFRRALNSAEHAGAHALRRRRNRLEVDIEVRMHRDHS
jgi:hypothetical protein